VVLGTVIGVVLLAGAAAGGVLATRGSGPKPSHRAVTTRPAPAAGRQAVRAPSRGTPADSLPRTPGAGPCTSLRVLASLEDRDLLTALARAYQGARRDIAGHCVSVHVDASASGDATNEVVGGFAQEPDSMRPAIWWPDSSDWLSIAHADQAHGSSSSVPDHGTSVARTPIVLAMPAPQAAALGWDKNPPTWRDYLRFAGDPDVWAKHGHAAWGSFNLGKTSPQTATSGLDGLVAAYAGAAGKDTGLTPAAVHSATVQAAVHTGERTTVHYGSSEDNFLVHIRDSESTGDVANSLSVVTLDEKSVWDYNRGHLSTGGVDGMSGMGEMNGMTGGDSGPPKTPLVPIYPKDGTYVADNPAAVLDGSWVSPAQQKAATDLIRFARTAQGQGVVRANGYRDLGDQIDPQVAKTGDYRDGSVRTLPSPSADVLTAVQKSFPAVRKRARVLFAFDVSRSMSAILPDGHSKLQDAQQAAVKALKYFSDSDQVGLAAFSNQAGQQSVTPGVVAPVGPLSSDRDELIRKIDDLTAVDQTPLYRAVPEFVSSMTSHYSGDDINAIVLLSDGTNDTDVAGSMSSMTQQMTAATKGKPIRVFTLGYGTDADTPTLQHIAEMTGAHYYDATNPDTVSAVLSDLVTNF
jgi:Ca-activated chloride channel family protein